MKVWTLELKTAASDTSAVEGVYATSARARAVAVAIVAWPAEWIDDGNAHWNGLDGDAYAWIESHEVAAA